MKKLTQDDVDNAYLHGYDLGQGHGYIKGTIVGLLIAFVWWGIYSWLVN